MFPKNTLYMNKLQNVKVGMSRQQVIEAMGSPSNQLYDKQNKTRRLIYNLQEYKGGWAETRFSCCIELVNDSVTRWGRLVAGELEVMNELYEYQTAYESDSIIIHKNRIEERLQMLKSYYEKGLITEDEYTHKKKEILKTL
jgi:hypothetical protein